MLSYIKSSPAAVSTPQRTAPHRPPPRPSHWQPRCCAPSMRQGETLFLQYRATAVRAGPEQRPCRGRRNCQLLINDASIVPAGGALFDGMPAQTWRHVND